MEGILSGFGVYVPDDETSSEKAFEAVRSILKSGLAPNTACRVNEQDCMEAFDDYESEDGSIGILGFFADAIKECEGVSLKAAWDGSGEYLFVPARCPWDLIPENNISLARCLAIFEKYLAWAGATGYMTCYDESF